MSHYQTNIPCQFTKLRSIQPWLPRPFANEPRLISTATSIMESNAPHCSLALPVASPTPIITSMQLVHSYPSSILEPRMVILTFELKLLIFKFRLRFPPIGSGPGEFSKSGWWGHPLIPLYLSRRLKARTSDFQFHNLQNHFHRASSASILRSCVKVGQLREFRTFRKLRGFRENFPLHSSSAH